MGSEKSMDLDLVEPRNLILEYPFIFLVSISFFFFFPRDRAKLRGYTSIPNAKRLGVEEVGEVEVCVCIYNYIYAHVV